MSFGIRHTAKACGPYRSVAFKHAQAAHANAQWATCPSAGGEPAKHMKVHERQAQSLEMHKGRLHQ